MSLIENGNDILNLIIEEMNIILKKDFNEDIIKKIKNLKKDFSEKLLEQQKKQKLQYQKSVETGEDEKGYFEPIKYVAESNLRDTLENFKQKNKKWLEKQEETKKENHTQKKKIVEEIEILAQKEKNSRQAIERIKELENKWNELNKQPKIKQTNIQSQYIKAKDKFYYNLKIYRDLLQYHFKRNLQLREEIISKIKKLPQIKSIKTMEQMLYIYNKEWKEIGGVHKKDWDKISKIYIEEIKIHNEKIKEYYSEKKEQQKIHIEQKNNLIEQVEIILNKQKLEKNELNKQIEKVQENWRKIGYIEKKINDKLWENFKQKINNFYTNKKELYKANTEKKKKLITEIQSIENPEKNWITSTKKVIDIQKKWKKIGLCNYFEEKKLWTNFKSICDSFFKKKNDYYKQQKEEEKQTIKEKQEIIKKIELIKFGENKEENKELLNSIINKYNTIAKNLSLNDDKLNISFDKIIKKQHKIIGVSNEESKNILFKHKIDEIKKSRNPDKIIYKEEKNIIIEIKELKNIIIQYENNLDFFRYSKGKESDKLKAPIEQKVKQSKEKLEYLEKKHKQLKKIKSKI